MFTKKEIAVLTLRKEGLTQVEVARKLRISQAAVSKFEQNAQRKLRDAQETVRLATILDIAVEEPYDRLLDEVQRDLKKAGRGGDRK